MLPRSPTVQPEKEEMDMDENSEDSPPHSLNSNSNSNKKGKNRRLSLAEALLESRHTPLPVAAMQRSVSSGTLLVGA